MFEQQLKTSTHASQLTRPCFPTTASLIIRQKIGQSKEKNQTHGLASLLSNCLLSRITKHRSDRVPPLLVRLLRSNSLEQKPKALYMGCYVGNNGGNGE